MDTTWKIGDLIWVPRKPLGMFAKVGDTDFWKIGIITSMDAYDCVWFFHNNHFEKIHVDHIRSALSHES